MNKLRSSASGQVLLESLITHFLQMLLMVILLVSVLGVSGTALLHADAYSLARSSLYGTPRICKPTREWPRTLHIALRYQCFSHAETRAQISFTNDIGFAHKIKIKLRPM